MADHADIDLLRQITVGYFLPRSLHVVADMGVADHLGDEPQPVSRIAKAVDAHPEALLRIFRLLSAYGVFKLEGDIVSHNGPSRLLRSDHPQSQRAITRVEGNPLAWRACGDLEYTVRTGLPSMEKIAPDFFNYVSLRPELAKLFNEGMTAKAHADIAALLGAYDFSPFATIGDIGGGRGHMIQAILQATPRAKGILFDLPSVLQAVQGIASDRLTLQAGNFFRTPLPVCDGYILMDVIHDWNDETSIELLRAVRRAAPSHAKLLLIEVVMTPLALPSYVMLMDIGMLAGFGGKQRTEEELAALCAAAGFRIDRTIPTQPPYGISILECSCI